MNYKKDIRDKLGDKEIDRFKLIETIISIYGEPVMNETVMNDILTKLLGENGELASYAITFCPNASQKLNWRYHTSDGEGYITEKNT